MTIRRLLTISLISITSILCIFGCVPAYDQISRLNHASLALNRLQALRSAAEVIQYLSPERGAVALAVVAGEVKTLATQTAKATEEIETQIAEIQGQTGVAVAAIQGIESVVSQIESMTGSVAAAVEEQTAATQEIARNVQQVAQGANSVSHSISKVKESTQETSRSVETLLATAADLSHQTEALRNEVSTFISSVKAL